MNVFCSFIVFVAIGSVVKADYYSELRDLQSVCSYMRSIPADWSKPELSMSDEELLTRLRISRFSATGLLQYNSYYVLRFCARAPYSLKVEYLTYLTGRIDAEERRLFVTNQHLRLLRSAHTSILEFNKLVKYAEAASDMSEETPEAVVEDMETLVYEILGGRETFMGFAARFEPRPALLKILQLPLHGLGSSADSLVEQIEAKQSDASAIAEGLEQLRAEYHRVENTSIDTY